MIMTRTLASSILLLAVGCGGGSTHSSELIAAESGGSVSLDDSVLAIPPTALAADTEVSMHLDSIDELAPLADAHDQVLVIEPADVTLAIPGTLTLDLGGPVMSGELVVIHHLVDGGWSPLATEEVSGGLVAASVSALGSYAVTRRAAAQDGNRIVGVLTWGDASPAAQTPIQLHQDGSLLRETVTDGAGAFGFADLTPGAYKLVVSFECELEQAVTVTAEAPTEVELVLCPF